METEGPDRMTLGACLTPTWDALDPDGLCPTGNFDFTQIFIEPPRLPVPPIPQEDDKS